METCEVLVSTQQTYPTNHLNQINLSLKILNGVEYECKLKLELIESPEADMLIKAKLSYSKRKLFAYIQEMQVKDLEARKVIYDLIRKLDQQVDGKIIHRVQEKETRKQLM